MKGRGIIAALLFATATLSAAGQQVAEPAASTAVREAEYLARFQRLNRQFVATPTDVDVLIQLADFYGDTLNPMGNLPLAMDYICQAESLYVAMVNDDSRYREMTRLLKKQITLKSIRESKQSIVDRARDVVGDNATLSESEIARYAESFREDAVVNRDVRKQRLENAYLVACAQNTIDAYYQFEQRYQGTAEADSAEAAIERLAPALFERIESEAETEALARRYGKSQAVQTIARRHKSRLAYAAATLRHTVEGYRAFLSAYPSSEEYMQALDEMESLLAARYATLSTAQDYIDFIEANSDDELAEEAMERLCEIIKRDQNVEAAKNYLEKFPLDHHYNDIYRLYYEWHAAEGNLQPIQEFANSQKDYPFRMALQADLIEGAQVDSFDLMRPYVESRKAEYVSFIRRHTGKRIAFVAMQRMIQPQRARREWKSANDRMGSVMLSFDEVSADEFNQLRHLLTTPPDPRATSTLEYAGAGNVTHPVIHPDGEHLYFTRIDKSGSRIMVAARRKGRWDKAEEVRFANEENNGLTLFNFFDDGERMLLGKEGDIWIAQRDGDDWRVVEIPPYPVNTDYIETDAYMLPDGTGMLLASDRKGGYNLQHSGAYYHGDTALATDLYFIPRTLKGWGKPVNLGANINTTCCERSPLLSRNQKTLYFVSDGHGGFGYGDIWMATRTSADDWTQWSAPVNLGREVNTCFDEASITFMPDEAAMLAASNHQGNRYECFHIGVLHDASNPMRSVAVDARAVGKSLTQIDVADFTLQGLARELPYPDASKPIPLNLYRGKRYVIYGVATGFYIPALMVGNNDEGTIPMKAYEVEELVRMETPVALSTVSFDVQAVQPTPLSMTEIDRLAGFLQDHPTLRVDLMMNARGSNRKDTYELTLKRGQSLRRYLASMGIEINRIDVSAFGNSLYRAGTPGTADMMVRFLAD